MNRIQQFWNQIKQRIHQFCINGSQRIGDDISDLRGTKWLSEILKGAIISIFTIIVLYCIRLFWPGNYDGIKLENYLQKKILEHITASNIKNQILYNGKYDVLSEDKVIFVYSKYTTSESDNLGDEYYDGVCLSVFEKGESNILNEILGTSPAYQLVFCSNYEGYSMTLKYLSFEYEDLDNDGLIEFQLLTNSFFATTRSMEHILFTKENENWSIVTPKIENIRKNISNTTKCDLIINHSVENNSGTDYGRTIYLDASLIRLKDLLNQENYYDILGVTDYGSISHLKNPFNSSFEIAYKFSCSYTESNDSSYIYIMQQFNHKELFTDPNWNMGKPLIMDEEMDFQEECKNYWGIQTEDSIFFADPDNELN